MGIVVEQQAGNKVEVKNPQHIFHAGDLVRFRFRSSFDGYLYVMDQSTSGKYLLLFPVQEVQNANRVEQNKEYLIPATNGSWFRVDDPPGYETVYFLISPVPMEKAAVSPPHPLPAEPPPPSAPAALLPRCDDSVFRARGECVDVLAGPRSVSPDETLPSQLPITPGATPRDITVINKPAATVVAPKDGAMGPLIYQFRLAHR
ncbi:DUF4384 domain-containing protein [Paracidobacterium acidisoli]|nr:DUF4384 domain-containing protein [Paracidobacterium acidisoli]